MRDDGRWTVQRTSSLYEDFVRGDSDDLALGIEPRRVLEEARRSPPGCAIGSWVPNAAVVIHSSSHLSCVQKSPVILSCSYAMMRMSVDRALPKSGECASILTWKARKQPIISNYIPSHAPSGFCCSFHPADRPNTCRKPTGIR